MNGFRDNCAYNVGLYIRLSREDDEKIDESISIKNQRTFLEEYVTNNRFNLVDEYVDDGYSGTNFDRPAFQRMISDIEDGKINCVITKDMSRLGRDYIGTGIYIEKYFPEHKVRFIAINDCIDLRDGEINDVAPFKALMNDFYAKDISKKVKSSIETLKRNGMFLGGVPPYGYKFASDDNHKKLVIDEETAPIVRRMFNMYANGSSLQKIVDTFNSEHIPIPSVKKNLNRGNKSMAYGYWQTRTIDEILKNPTYIGNLTQGRNRKVNYKSKKTVRVPKDKWIICEGTHEPIIDKDTFNKVQNIYEKNKNRKSSKNNVLLAGFLYCKDCGHKIGINKSGNNKFYCSCNFYKKYSKENLCTPHSMAYDKLEEIVLDEIRKECKKSIKNEDMVSVLKNNNKKQVAIEKIIKLIDKKKTEIRKNQEAVDELYISKLKKEINEERYRSVFNKLNKELDTLEQDLKMLESDYSSLLNNNAPNNELSYSNIVREYLKMKNPTRELLACLIDKIVIAEDKTISIYYKIKRYY